MVTWPAFSLAGDARLYAPILPAFREGVPATVVGTARACKKPRSGRVVITTHLTT